MSKELEQLKREMNKERQMELQMKSMLESLSDDEYKSLSILRRKRKTLQEKREELLGVIGLKTLDYREFLETLVEHMIFLFLILSIPTMITIFIMIIILGSTLSVWLSASVWTIRVYITTAVCLSVVCTCSCFDEIIALLRSDTRRRLRTLKQTEEWREINLQLKLCAKARRQVKSAFRQLKKVGKQSVSFAET